MMDIRLDDGALKRANPPRGTKVALPTPEAGREALRALSVPNPGVVGWWMDSDAPEIAQAVRAAIRDGAEVKDPGAAAGVLAMLDPYEEEIEPLIESVVVWLAASLRPAELFRALVASNHIDGRATTTHYDYMKRGVWLAVARVFCEASDDEYRAVRDEAAKLRKERDKDKGLRAALAMMFPSEPWGTSEAKAFKTEPRGPDADRAMCLLYSCDVWAASERLMNEMNANDSMTPSGPVYALLHRFGQRAEPLVIAAYDKSLKQRDDAASAWVAGALACIASPTVAALFQKRLGKKIGGSEAEAYFRRWPELAGKGAKKKPAAKAEARFAVLGNFDMYGQEGEGSIKAWRKCKTNPGAFGDWPKALARPKPGLVGEALDRWKKRLEIDGDFPVEVRGVLSKAAFEADAVELLSLLRLGEDAPIYFNGELIAFSFDLGWGVRLEIYERGESELTVLDEVPDAEVELQKLLK